MSNPTTTGATIAPFNIHQAIANHHADMTACRDAATQCRKWAQAYLDAAAAYEAGASHAAGAMASLLQVKWGGQS